MAGVGAVAVAGVVGLHEYDNHEEEKKEGEEENQEQEVSISHQSDISYAGSIQLESFLERHSIHLLGSKTAASSGAPPLIFDHRSSKSLSNRSRKTKNSKSSLTKQASTKKGASRRSRKNRRKQRMRRLKS